MSNIINFSKNLTRCTLSEPYVETGKSDFIRNIKQDLIAKYDKVLVVATEKKAFEKVERELAGAGLLGIDRIEIFTIKYNFLMNAQHNLTARYNKITVVATNNSAFEKIKKQLAQNGLLIADRIELVLAGDRNLMS